MKKIKTEENFVYYDIVRSTSGHFSSRKSNSSPSVTSLYHEVEVVPHKNIVLCQFTESVGVFWIGIVIDTSWGEWPWHGNRWVDGRQKCQS